MWFSADDLATWFKCFLISPGSNDRPRLSLTMIASVKSSRMHRMMVCKHWSCDRIKPEMRRSKKQLNYSSRSILIKQSFQIERQQNDSRTWYMWSNQIFIETSARHGAPRQQAHLEWFMGKLHQIAQKRNQLFDFSEDFLTHDAIIGHCQKAEQLPVPNDSIQSSVNLRQRFRITDQRL